MTHDQNMRANIETEEKTKIIESQFYNWMLWFQAGFLRVDKL